MYSAVKAWVFERGGRLHVSGRKRTKLRGHLLGPDGSMRCLSHLHSEHGEMGGKSADGSHEYESRMHRTLESEANLLGVVCTETGIMTAAPYQRNRHVALDIRRHRISRTAICSGKERCTSESQEAPPATRPTSEAPLSANTVLLAKGTIRMMAARRS